MAKRKKPATSNGQATKKGQSRETRKKRVREVVINADDILSDFNSRLTEVVQEKEEANEDSRLHCVSVETAKHIISVLYNTFSLLADDAKFDMRAMYTKPLSPQQKIYLKEIKTYFDSQSDVIESLKCIPEEEPDIISQVKDDFSRTDIKALRGYISQLGDLEFAKSPYLGKLLGQELLKALKTAVRLLSRIRNLRDIADVPSVVALSFLGAATSLVRSIFYALFYQMHPPATQRTSIKK